MNNVVLLVFPHTSLLSLVGVSFVFLVFPHTGDLLSDIVGVSFVFHILVTGDPVYHHNEQ